MSDVDHDYPESGPATATDGEWELQHDESTGRAFYVNTRTGEASWEAPASSMALAEPMISPQWTEAYDDEGRLYYVNVETMATSWDAPPGFYGSARAPESTCPTISDGHRTEEPPRPSTAEQMERLNALLSGGDGEDDEGEDDDPNDDGSPLLLAPISELSSGHILDTRESDPDGPALPASVDLGDAGTPTVGMDEHPGSQWMMFINEADGVPYYYNHLTGECVWEPPEDFLEYHEHYAGGDANHQEVADPHPLDETASVPTGEQQPTARAARTPTMPDVPITPEFEDKVRRAIESVSKTPVGSSRLPSVRTPTFRSTGDDKSTGRASRPSSSSASARRNKIDADVSNEAPGSVSRDDVASPSEYSTMATAIDGASDAAQPTNDNEDIMSTSKDDFIRELRLVEAVVMIQCLGRCFLARRRVRRRREEKVEILQQDSEDNMHVEKVQSTEQGQEPKSLGILDVQTLNSATNDLMVVSVPIYLQSSAPTSPPTQTFDGSCNMPTHEIEQIVVTADSPLAMPLESVEVKTISHTEDHASYDDRSPGSADHTPALKMEGTVQSLQTITSTPNSFDLSKQAASPQTIALKTDQDSNFGYERGGQGSRTPGDMVDAPKQPISLDPSSNASSNPSSTSNYASAAQSTAVSIEATAPSVRQLANPQARSSRRTERPPSASKTQASRVPPHDSPVLAVLDISTYFPIKVSRPSNMSPTQKTASPRTRLNVAHGIVRKPISNSQQTQLRSWDSTRQSRPLIAQTLSVDSKNVEGDQTSEEELQACRVLFNETAESHRNTIKQIITTRESEIHSGIRRNRKIWLDKRQDEIRQQEDSHPAEPWDSDPPLWDLVGKFERPSSRSLELVRTAVAQCRHPDTFLATMLQERLRQIRKKVARLHVEMQTLDTKIDILDAYICDEQPSSKLSKSQQALQRKFHLSLQAKRRELQRSLSYWKERIRGFSQEPNEIKDPYWRRVYDRLISLLNTHQFSDAIVSHRASNGDSMLHVAAWRGNIDVVKFLVDEAGFDVNGVDSSVAAWTPLHEACRGGHDSIVHFLVERGAAIDMCDHHADSALHIACRLGWSRIVQILVSAAEANAESTKFRDRTRTLQTCSWAEFFNLKNDKHQRAIELVKLPSLYEFLKGRSVELAYTYEDSATQQSVKQYVKTHSTGTRKHQTKPRNAKNTRPPSATPLYAINTQ